MTKKKKMETVVDHLGTTWGEFPALICRRESRSEKINIILCKPLIDFYAMFLTSRGKVSVDWYVILFVLIIFIFYIIFHFDMFCFCCFILYPFLNSSGIRSGLFTYDTVQAISPSDMCCLSFSLCM